MLAALPGPAAAGELLSSRIGTSSSAFRQCGDDRLPSAGGAVQRAVTAPSLGWVTARLDGSRGDWDLAVFDAGNGDLVAGGSSFGPDEVASGMVGGGQRLTVQACRLSGAGGRAKLDVEFSAIDTSRKPERASMVQIPIPNKARRTELSSLGLDLSEHGGKKSIGAVLYGQEDHELLREHKFVYTTEVRDLAQATVERHRADRAFAARAARARAAAFPSNRSTYRRLNDYGDDLKKLARENPGLVKPITLPFKTWEGRAVEGIEVTENVASTTDGKPIFLNMGIHHAREWPSGEHAMEWAFELVNKYKAGDGRVRDLMRRTRTIVIPVINPDGFNTSREAGQAAGAGNGRIGGDDTPYIVTVPYEFHRKNCRTTNPNGDDPESGSCTQQPASGLQQFGTDPNRNYGGFWGGPGASPPGPSPGTGNTGDYEQNYRGNAPFSEPETRNVRDLVSKRQVTTLITNHTASNLVLRPPGLQSLGPSIDEDRGYKALGDAMAAENGYNSQLSYELYDTTGTTEDWTYSVTGGFGFTFEIGCNDKDEGSGDCNAYHFHPVYQDVMNEWSGDTEEANENGRDGLGNREAYYKALESTADAGRHSVLGGRGPGGAILRLKKSFKTKTSPVIGSDRKEGPHQEFDDTLDTTLEVPGPGTFEWHINPSTRPVVAKATGRPKTGEPSGPHTFSGSSAGATDDPQNDGATPTVPPNANAPEPIHFNDHPFTVPSGAGADNAKFTVEVKWGSPATDWDMKVYRDLNGDGKSWVMRDVDGDGTQEPTEEGPPVGTSQTGPSNLEQATATANNGEKFVVRMNNFAGIEAYNGTVTFQGPDPFTPAQTESWRLTCESFSGTVLTSQDVFIDRGQRQDPGLQACTAAFNRAFATGIGCDRPTGKAARTSVDRAKLGRDRVRHLRSFKIGRRSRSSVDKFCFTDRRQIRIGYPSRKLRRKLGPKNKRRYTANKAVLILTSSKRFKIRGVKVGSSTRTLRRRIGRLRGIKVGRNTWYARSGSKSRLVFKVRGRKVYEIGIADRGLNKTRASQRRFFDSFR